jgi:hypothetical protein
MAPQPLRHGVQFCAIVVVEPSTCQAPQSAICNCPFPAPPVRQRALADLAFLDLQPWGAASGKYAVLGTQCPVASYDAVGTQYCVLCTAYSPLGCSRAPLAGGDKSAQNSRRGPFSCPAARRRAGIPKPLLLMGLQPTSAAYGRNRARDLQTNVKTPKPLPGRELRRGRWHT